VPDTPIATPIDSPAASHDPYAALRLPPFRWFVSSMLTMTLGAQIQGVVVGWQVYDLTKDPLSLGLMGLAEALPYISMALWAGHVADRGNRRRIALTALTVLVCCSAALLALTATGAAARGHRGLLAIYGVIVVSGLARSFLQPARQGMNAEIVPRAMLPNAVTWRTSIWQTAAVLGPAAGGFLYGFGGPTIAYTADLTLMVIALLAFAMVAYRPAPREEAAGREGTWTSLTTGVRYVLRQPVLAGAMTLDMFAVFFGGATALLPVFADEVLHVGPKGLGLLRAAPAAGAVAMSLILAHRPPMRRAGRRLFACVAIFGLCMIGFALSRSVALSLALLAASGAVDMVSVVIRSTLLQTWTPTHLMGRVSSVNSIFVGSSNEIGMFESGVAAKALGTVPSVIFGGCMTLLVVAATAWRVPILRRLDRLESPKGVA
jgi:MFS family permease